MTRRDGLPRFSAISVGRGDAGHREASATLSESLGKPPLRSSMRPARGLRRAPYFYSGGAPATPGATGCPRLFIAGGAPATPGGVGKP